MSVVTGNLVQSLEGGRKPSPALPPAVTPCVTRPFLNREALDTLIWVGEVRWCCGLLWHLVRVLPVQAQGDEHQEHHDKGVRGVEVGEDQAQHGQ